MNPLSYYNPNDPYPESDGRPMAENTEQYDWLVKIKENLEILFADREDVFVAGDLLWYSPGQRPPRKGRPAARVAFPCPHCAAMRERGEGAKRLRGVSSRFSRSRRRRSSRSLPLRRRTPWLRAC